jgi:hypothetical protein
MLWSISAREAARTPHQVAPRMGAGAGSKGVDRCCRAADRPLPGFALRTFFLGTWTGYTPVAATGLETSTERHPTDSSRGLIAVRVLAVGDHWLVRTQ